MAVKQQHEVGRWSESAARSALSEFAKSGMSAAAFARARGISTQRLWYWQKRLAPLAAVSFVPVRLPVRSSSAAATATSPTSEHIEIVCGEVVVRVGEDVDPERVARIAAALSVALSSGRC
jgi:hypothetical protein